jgi:hypothetical protein
MGGGAVNLLLLAKVLLLRWQVALQHAFRNHGTTTKISQ